MFRSDYPTDEIFFWYINQAAPSGGDYSLLSPCAIYFAEKQDEKNLSNHPCSDPLHPEQSSNKEDNHFFVLSVQFLHQSLYKSARDFLLLQPSVNKRQSKKRDNDSIGSHG